MAWSVRDGLGGIWGPLPLTRDGSRARVAKALRQARRLGILTAMTDQPDHDYADTLEAQMIADYVSDGMPLAAACRVLGVERRQTIYEHMDKSARFRDMMEKARADGYDVLAEQCLEIADDAALDTIETRFGPKPDKEWIARSKLRVETRLKLLAKWHPKKYGDKLQVEQKTATVAIPVTDDPIAAQRAYESLMRGDL